MKVRSESRSGILPLVEDRSKRRDAASTFLKGGLGKAHQLFGDQLPKLLDELNTVLSA
jgi:hypothetical protein